MACYLVDWLIAQSKSGGFQTELCWVAQWVGNDNVLVVALLAQGKGQRV